MGRRLARLQSDSNASGDRHQVIDAQSGLDTLAGDATLGVGYKAILVGYDRLHPTSEGGIYSMAKIICAPMRDRVAKTKRTEKLNKYTNSASYHSHQNVTRPSQGLLLLASHVLCIIITSILLISSPGVLAQTAVTGGLSGIVTDSSGGIVPNATVKVVNTSTGDVRSVTTNNDGRYEVPFLKPGPFTVSASAPGLQSQPAPVQILVSQRTALNLTLTPLGTAETVTVSAYNPQLIDTESANLTSTFTTKQFQDLPAPGGDISTIAYSVPGVVMATGTGGTLDSFSSNGIPGSSNLIIINGADNMNSYLSVSNTGASSLSLGQQEIEQASVIQNGYDAQYGRQAGAIETYLTKQGTNRIHGLLLWNYNGDVLNANSFFNNLTGTPRSKAVSNQYAAQVGGPILPDKLFFFAHTEGIRYVEPISNFVNFPSSSFQNTILNTIPSSDNALYQQMFNLLATAPSYNSAVPVTTGNGPLQDSSGHLGCGSYAGTPVSGEPNTYFGTAPAGGTAVPCVNSSFTPGSDLITEWYVSGRIDWDISGKQKVFLRATDDYGNLPCCNISVVNPALTGALPQPLISAQLNHVYTFNPRTTNQLIVATLYQSALQKYSNIQRTLSLSPTEFVENVDGGTNDSPGLGQGGIIGNVWSGFPFGEATHQYQLIDDVSWLRGNHTLKFGINLKRYLVTDEENETGNLGGVFTFNSLRDLVSGSLPGASDSSFTQTFSSVPVIRSREYNYGFYAQDEWKMTSTVGLYYGLRVERNGNPLCYGNCFSQYLGGFPNGSATLNTPYDATILTNRGHAFQSIEAAVFEPRLGFSWNLRGRNKTVIRGGFGLFSDEFAAGLIAPLYASIPNVFAPSVFSGLVSEGSGGAPDIAQTSFDVVRTGFSSGQSANQLAADLPPGVPFSPPNYSTGPNEFRNPKYTEWSIQAEQQITPADAIIFSYTGNHGYDLLITNFTTNQNLGGDAYLPASLYSSFDLLPTAPPDPRFKQVETLSNGGKSNYEGASLQYKHIAQHGFTTDVSYTYSHALDDVSVGAAGPGTPFTNNTVNSQITPYSASHLMYSNSDFDVRQNLALDAAYVEPLKFRNRLLRAAGAGWTVAGKAYWRTGMPFSVFNGNAASALYNGSGPSTVLATALVNNFDHSCNSFSHPCLQTPNTFNGTGLTVGSTGTIVPNPPANAPTQSPQTIFGNIPRNSMFGPHYGDIDASIYKNIASESAVNFQIGAQIYNLLNHPNFAPPQNNASLSQSFGIFNNTVSAPSSPYGFFSGSAVSGRVVVVTGRITF